MDPRRHDPVYCCPVINVQHYIADSEIPGSGQGFFAGEDLSRGAVIVAPAGLSRVLSWDELSALPIDSVELRTSMRWFEERYAVGDWWTTECFINHSSDPTGLIHLGFVFAMRPLRRGTEITIDYRLFLGEGYRMPFLDGATGQPIIGLSWAESVYASSSALARIFAPQIG
jgi:hypothetical protein